MERKEIKKGYCLIKKAGKEYGRGMDAGEFHETIVQVALSKDRNYDHGMGTKRVFSSVEPQSTADGYEINTSALLPLDTKTVLGYLKSSEGIDLDRIEGSNIHDLNIDIRHFKDGEVEWKKRLPFFIEVDMKPNENPTKHSDYTVKKAYVDFSAIGDEHGSILKKWFEDAGFEFE